MRTFSIKTKMLAILASVIIGLLVLMSWNAFSTYESLLRQRQNELESLIDNSISVMARQQARVEAGEVSLEVAQAEAAATIQNLRYRGSEYFFILDMDTRLVMHPFRPDLEGQDVSGTADPDGVHLFVEMVNVARDTGRGIVRYMWPKAGAETPSPKMSFVARDAQWDWIVGTGVYIDDLHSLMIQRLMESAFLLLIFGGLLTVTILAITRSILRPISSLGQTMNELAAGQLEQAVVEADRTDEIGQMARRVEHFREGLRERRDLEAQGKDEQARRETRQKRIDALTTEFQEITKGVLEGVSRNAAKLHQASTALQDVTATTLDQAEHAAKQSSETSSNVQTVAAASEELSSSIGEIQHNVSATAETVSETASRTEDANIKINRLNEAGQRIGTVVSLISDIAEQTNLLALNATIEAARAGEAGKGFAVVASEVKSLANQTSGAISEISSQIESVQLASKEAVSAIDAISDAMGSASDTTAAIAAAVQQQGAATTEISRNAQSAADGTQNVATAAQSVSESARSVEQSSADIRAVADGVTQDAETLRRELATFLDGIAAA